MILARKDFSHLFRALAARGYTILGPVMRDGAIVYDEVSGPEELPIGWTDEQTAGSYRLGRSGREACFDYVVGPQSWKKYLHPPKVRLWAARREENGFTVIEGPRESPRYAFLGVRACELEAIARQDRVFLGGAFVDSIYRANREGAFLIAVNCTRAGGNCFCGSMKTGPRAGGGFDLALTEVIEEQSHYFLVEAGTDRGSELLAELPARKASAAQRAAAEDLVAQAAARMGRAMETEGLKDLLQQNSEHREWSEVAKRCLTCANCTMVCPTCFCSTVEDVTDLKGDHAERWRKWDSCFTMDFSYIHGGSVRPSTRTRYRQWMTHKLASWIDQYGTSGCVGCGRCITWCPVGIDLTEEVRVMRGLPRLPEEK